MSLNISWNENTLELAGTLNAENAPQFESVIDSVIDTADSLVIDVKDLEYISSAGLRVLLKAHNALSGAGGLKLINVPQLIMEVFEITGFTEFLSLEPAEEEVAGTYYRKMKASDIPAVKALIERALLDEKVQLIHEDFENEAWLESYDLDYFTSIVEHSHAYLMFEDQTDTLVASGYIKLSDDGKSSFVGMLFSDPAFRHLRLGSKMLEILENDPFAQETKKVVLHSSMSAYKFYKKMGYDFPNGKYELMQEEDDTYGMALEKNL